MEEKNKKKKLTLTVSKKSHKIPNYTQSKGKTSVVIEKKPSRKWGGKKFHPKDSFNKPKSSPDFPFKKPSPDKSFNIRKIAEERATRRFNDLNEKNVPNKKSSLGREKTFALRKQDQLNKVPIVACSADVFPEARKNAIKAGIDFYLTKPLKEEALKEVLYWLISDNSSAEKPVEQKQQHPEPPEPQKAQPETAPSSIDLNQLFAKAMEFHTNGDLIEAKNICESILQKQPNEPAILYRLALIYYDIGNFNAAKNHLNRIITLDGENAGIHLTLAAISFRIGDIDSAIKHSKKSVKIF